MIDTEALLKRQKADIFKELVSLSRDPQRARELIADLSQAEAALSYLTAAKAGKYTGFKRGRDALKALFKESQRPWGEEDLKKEIVDRGGWRRGEGGIVGAHLALQKSIKLHIHGDGAKRWPLKILNGLIGPKEWPDDLFKDRE